MIEKHAGRDGYAHPYFNFLTAVAVPIETGDRLELLRSRGYSYRQIAYMTGTPRQTVHDRVRGKDRRKVPPLPPPSPFSLARPL